MKEEIISEIQDNEVTTSHSDDAPVKKRRAKKSEQKKTECPTADETDTSLSSDDITTPADKEKPKAKRKPRKKAAPLSEIKSEDADKDILTEEQISLFDSVNSSDAQNSEPDLPQSEKNLFTENEIQADSESPLHGLEISRIDYDERDEMQDDTLSDESVRIVPPDEIFSSFSLKTEITTLEDIIPEESITADITDEDGQYTISDLIPEVSDQQKEEPSQEDNTSQKLPSYDPDKPRKIDARFDFVELVIFTLLIVMLITSFLFRHSVVDGESMENTLVHGEHLIISDLFYTPQRGDIIVCEDYKTGYKKPLVKRVIAVAGDTVSITAKGEVFVNGELLDESAYINIDNPKYHYKPLEITVDDGELFVMGDHRNMSSDSRDFGTVSVESVLGKVLLRFYPFDSFGVPK